MDDCSAALKGDPKALWKENRMVAEWESSLAVLTECLRVVQTVSE